MSSVFTKQVGTRFKVLESEIASDGSPVSALMLRTMARNANRLIGAPQLLFNFAWDSGWTDDELANGLTRLTAFAGYTSSMSWTRAFGPIRVPKKSVARTMQVSFYAHFNQDVCIQWVTTASPLSASKTATPATASPNVQYCPNSSETKWQGYFQSGLVLGSGNFETISAYIRGNASEETIDTAVYGSPASGTILKVENGIIIVSGSPTWVPVGSDPAVFSVADGSCYVAFLDPNGVLLTAPRGVTGYHDSVLFFQPFLTSAEMDLVTANGTYELRKWGDWRFANVTAYTEQVA